MLEYKIKNQQLFTEEEVSHLIDTILKNQEDLKENFELQKKYKENKEKVFENWSQNENLSEQIRNKLIENK